MRGIVPMIAAIYAAWLPALAAADASPVLTWIAEDGTVGWSSTLVAIRGTDGPSVPLTVGPWFPTLPDVGLDPLDPDAAQTRLRDFSGKVLILDFWASWCQPCAATLPSLQALRQAEQSRGLEVVAVNMGEDDGVVRQFAWALDLGLPIARYSTPLDQALHVDRLPTVIVADRQGRIRARFNGYRQGAEEQIARIARDLLEEQLPPLERLAEVLTGPQTLEARWSRVVGASVTGLAFAHGEQGAVLAAIGRELLDLGADGEIRSRRQVGPGVERLVLGPDAGRSAVFGYRPAGRRITRIPLDGGDPVSWESRTHVLDLLVEPAGSNGSTTLLLATTEGVERVGIDGSGIGTGDRPGTVWQIAAGSPGAIALDGEGGLRWLDEALGTVRLLEVPPGSRVLASGAGRAGVGVAPPSLEASALGSFGVGNGAVALAHGGELIILDLATGAEWFRARWPGITALAAGDLDRDERDELLVASGKRVTALGVAARATGHASP